MKLDPAVQTAKHAKYAKGKGVEAARVERRANAEFRENHSKDRNIRLETPG